MRLLVDEMYSPAVAEQLRARGHDAASVHAPGFRMLESEPDEEVWSAALAAGRVLVTENVGDFSRIQAEALSRGQPITPLIFTTDRQFPRGHPGTTGRLVIALDRLLVAAPEPPAALFLKQG